MLLRELRAWGIDFVEYDQTGTPPPADVVWVESPANPVLTTPDWEAVRTHGGLVVADATVSTPVFLRALDEGADVVVHSATKFLTGSHDASHSARRSRATPRRPRGCALRTSMGNVSSPHSASRLLRGPRLARPPHAPITATAT